MFGGSKQLWTNLIQHAEPAKRLGVGLRAREPRRDEGIRARVESQVQRALGDGARLLEGGRRLDAGPGWFYGPTVLTDVTPSNVVVREEVFGPIASILVVKDADELKGLFTFYRKADENKTLIDAQTETVQVGWPAAR